MILNLILRKWDDLPAEMKSESVRQYYEILCKKKPTLFIKGLFDFCMGVFMLIVLSPAILGISIAIKVDSPGPVLFRQTRVTQYGRRFKIYKFRTMSDHPDETGARITQANDSRITGIGSRIRKSRIDEIPQLLNIIRRDMSFVGTRPEVVKFVDRYTQEMMATLLLKAGVTSKASIQFKNEESMLIQTDDPDAAYMKMIMPQKMRINLKSIEELSIRDDIGTMIRTVIPSFGRSKTQESYGPEPAAEEEFITLDR